MSTDKTRPRDFIREIIDEDLRTGRHTQVVTRFPPEPNGYLHIGHAKSITLNFGIAKEYGGRCNLRFDDTNPEKEEKEYVDSIAADVRWLGYDYGPEPLYASDYFQRMYELAEHLIRRGKAYVDSLDEEQIREYRGTLTEPGKPSPYRDRSVEENLDLFRRMKAGEFPDGAHVLRAKADLASPNMKMRDPLLYRIRHASHHRTGDRWCIYPMYDYAHPLEDAFEGITHSICTLEFTDNREIYDWVIRETEVECVPRQYEFARLNLGYTMMSKRKLGLLVSEGHVTGWDDPRMPTLAALRRRGYTPEAIRSFCHRIGISRVNTLVDLGKLEFALRDDLNQRAPRVLAVLRPLKVVLTNLPDGHVDEIDAPYFPPDVGKPGTRKVPLSKELFIEEDDFAEEPPRGYKRLAPGRVVRLRHAGCIRCDEVVKDGARVVEVRCTYLRETQGGQSPDEKVWGVIHWVSASRSVPCEVRLYDRLFLAERPDAAGDFRAHLNPASLVTLTGCRVEPSVTRDDPETRYQFERQGYFYRDPKDSRPDALVFNRIVTLRDSWTKATRDAAAPPEPAATKKGPKKSAMGKVRPERRSRAEFRAEARRRDPTLAERFERYRKDLGLAEDYADVLTGELATADLFDAACAAHDAPASVAKWIVNEVPRALGDTPTGDAPFTGAQLGRLVALVDAGTLSSTAARDVLAEMARTGADPDAIVKARGLERVTDASALEPLVAEILQANAAKADEYRSGRKGLMGFLVGQVMKASGGKADPKLVKDLLESKLG